jgi:Na+/H+ antiporter NhaC
MTILVLMGYLVVTSPVAHSAELSNMPQSPAVDVPAVVLTGVPFTVTITVPQIEDGAAVTVAGKSAQFSGGIAEISGVVLKESGRQALNVTGENLRESVSVRVVSGWFSLLPPLIAIALALLLKEVLLALAVGIFCGLWVFHDFQFVTAAMRFADTALVESLSDADHASILLFTLILGGMVGILVRSGAMEGVVNALSRLAKTPALAQFATWMVSLCMFFDDYANTLITGNTMRPLTDRMRISREKLAFIVDSAAAPLASVAIISTWVGFELGVMNDAFASVGREGGYVVFLQCIPQRFYSILAPLFVLVIAFSGRDYGPMRKAEIRARTTGKLINDGARPLSDPAMMGVVLGDEIPRRWINAVIPVATVVLGLLVGLYYDGWRILGTETAPALLDAFRVASVFRVFLWSTIAGAIVAGVLVVTQKILTLAATMDAWVQGVRAMMMACIVLVLAWALGSVCDMVHTADFVVEQTKDWVHPAFLPTLTFVLGAAISFATGTSYGTMAILFPLMIPLALGVTDNPLGGDYHPVVLGTVGAVLSGAVFGDHCSPISDTTIMSSTSSSCDHIDHVKTQFPYAVTVGAVAILTGYLPTGFGFNPILGNLIGLSLLIGIVWLIGKRTPVAE